MAITVEFGGKIQVTCDMYRTYVLLLMLVGIIYMLWGHSLQQQFWAEFFGYNECPCCNEYVIACEID